MQNSPSPADPDTPVVTLSQPDVCQTQSELFFAKEQPNQNTEKILAAYNLANKFTGEQSLKLSELYQCFSGNLQSLQRDRATFIKTNLPRLLEFALNKVENKRSLASSRQLIEIIEGAAAQCLLVCEQAERAEAPEIRDIDLDESVNILTGREKTGRKEGAGPLALVIAEKAMDAGRLDLVERIIEAFEDTSLNAYNKDSKLIGKYGAFLLRRKDFRGYFRFRKPLMLDPQYFSSSTSSHGSRFNEFKEVIMDDSLDLKSWLDLVRSASDLEAMNSIWRCSTAAKDCGRKGEMLVSSMLRYLRGRKEDPSRIVLIGMIGAGFDDFEAMAESRDLLDSAEGDKLPQKEDQEKGLEFHFGIFEARHLARKAVKDGDFAELKRLAEVGTTRGIPVRDVFKYLQEQYSDPADVIRIYQEMYPLDKISDSRRMDLIHFLIKEKFYSEAKSHIEELNLGKYTSTEADEKKDPYKDSMSMHRTKAELLVELGEATANLVCFREAYELLRVRERADIASERRGREDRFTMENWKTWAHEVPKYIERWDEKKLIPIIIGNIARLGEVKEALKYTNDDARIIMLDREDCLIRIAAGTKNTEAIAGEIDPNDGYLLNDLAISCDDPKLKRQAQNHIFTSTGQDTKLRLAIQYGLPRKDYTADLVDVAAAAENVANAKTIQRPNRIDEVVERKDVKTIQQTPSGSNEVEPNKKGQQLTPTVEKNVRPWWKTLFQSRD